MHLHKQILFWTTILLFSSCTYYNCVDVSNKSLERKELSLEETLQTNNNHKKGITSYNLSSKDLYINAKSYFPKNKNNSRKDTLTIEGTFINKKNDDELDFIIKYDPRFIKMDLLKINKTGYIITLFAPLENTSPQKTLNLISLENKVITTGVHYRLSGQILHDNSDIINYEINDDPTKHHLKTLFILDFLFAHKKEKYKKKCKKICTPYPYKIEVKFGLFTQEVSCLCKN